MALTFPAENIFPVKGTVAAPVALTSSYVAGNIVSTGEANMVGILVNYVPGDETSIQVKVESTVDPTLPGLGLSASSNWYQQVTQSASGGTITLTPAIYSMTTSGIANPTLFTFIINPIKATGIRISVKSTGGTPTGTYSVQAVTGWV